VVDFSDPEDPEEIAYMTRGLIVWKLNDRAVRNSIKLGRSNPQTQEFSFDSRDRDRDR
jgi:hypothetical protein